MEASKPNTEATTIDFFAIWICRPFKRNQQEIVNTNSEAITNPEVEVWVNFETATGLKTRSKKLCISNRAVSGLKAIPTGFCIQALAMRIQIAERLEPIATIHVEKRWNFFETLFQPKNMTAKKVASRKKAKIPSMARGAPNISPTIQE